MELLDLLNVPYCTAPGEAEAECALLQKEGIVDAVLSEDVDCLMFGCTAMLRNWSSEGSRGSKSATHVNIYTDEAIKLDSDGMILVALMSGGDYIPAGVPDCGIKIACEAARAGFGGDLCRLLRNPEDITGLKKWKEKLEHELRTNESGFFRVKHKTLKIPKSFPDVVVMKYYTHPIVSSAEKILQLSNVNWNLAVDVPGLRKFVSEAFAWNGLSGAKKFVRGFAPALLIQKIQKRNEMQTEDETNMITSICGRRIHFSADGMPELRVEFIPIEIVGIDLELEEKRGPEIDIGSGVEAELGVEQNLTKSQARSTYDPTMPEREWVLEIFVKQKVPSMVEAWEETMKNPRKPSRRTPSQKTPTPKKPSARKAKGLKNTPQSGMKQGTIDSFFKVSKPNKRKNAKNQLTSDLEELSAPETEKTRKSGQRGVESQPTPDLEEAASSQELGSHPPSFLDPTKYINQISRS